MQLPYSGGRSCISYLSLIYMHRPALYMIIIIENRNVLSYYVLYLNIEEDIMVIQQQEEKGRQSCGLKKKHVVFWR